MAIQATTAASEHHPTAWYVQMNGRERAAFWASIGGWILDAMDVQILSFAFPAIIAAFAISNADAGLDRNLDLVRLGFRRLVCRRAVGSLRPRAHAADHDRLVRRLYRLCGFAQNYTQLLTLRALMGFGFGGEWAAAAVLVGEIIRPENRGKAVGAMQSGWAIGWGLAALSGHAVLQHHAGRDRLARVILGRRYAGADGVFHPPRRR